MSLRPFLQRLLGYFAGITVWCLVIGPANRLGSDLTPIGEAGLAVVLLCAPLLLWLHLRRQRAAAGVPAPVHGAGRGLGN